MIALLLLASAARGGVVEDWAEGVWTPVVHEEVAFPPGWEKNWEDPPFVRTIDTSEDWTVFCSRISPTTVDPQGRPIAPAVPEIDFASQKVVVISMGLRQKVGHELELWNVAQGLGFLLVDVHLISPGPRCVFFRDRFHPHVIFRIPREVEYEQILLDVHNGVADCE